VVCFPLGQYGDTDNDNDGDVLHHTQNSPYVAVCLAAYMGAARIGLIPPLPRKTLPALTINPLHSILAETDQIAG
jgi:hypothetical protein